MMHHNGFRVCDPEVITLSDSDDEVLITPTSSAATASVSILHERPLSPSAFLTPPIQHTSLTNSTLFDNSDPTHGLEANRINGLASHIHVSKRHSNELDQTVPTKRFRDERTRRVPLQQTSQFESAWSSSPHSGLTVVTPSPSCVGSRQSNVHQGRNGTIALKRHSAPIANLNSDLSSVSYLTSHSSPQAEFVPMSSTPHASSTRQTNRQTYQVVQQARSISRQVHLAAEQIRQAHRLSHQPQSRLSISPSMTAQTIRSTVPQPQLISRPHQETVSQRRQLQAPSGSQMRPVESWNSWCYESRDPKGPAVEPMVCTAKFKCSYGRCSKQLPNNVSLMFHVWSHLVFDRTNGCTEDDEQDNVLMSLATCAQCLQTFPSAHAMQTHFSSVHSSNPHQSTCRVCELVVSSGNHVAVHGDDDAPYHCRKCRYRTSLRTDLLNHFVRVHANSRSLLCPFCLVTFNIGQNHCYDAVVAANGYVDHMMQHKTGKNIRCWSCALTFVRQSDRRMHKKDHTRKNPKWKSKPVLDAQIWMGRKLHRKSNELRCVECGEEVQDVQEHTRQARTCARCNYKTSCDHEYMHHKGVKCNVSRMGIVRSRLLQTLVECAGCGRKCADAAAIFPHLAECSGGEAIIRQREQLPIDEADSANERLEAECFGLCHREMNQENRRTLGLTKKICDQEQKPSVAASKILEILQDGTDEQGWLQDAERDVYMGADSLAAELEDVLEIWGDETLKNEEAGTETS